MEEGEAAGTVRVVSGLGRRKVTSGSAKPVIGSHMW